VARAGKGKAKFTVGKETTYVAGPLDDRGNMDYEAALNERLGKDVTPEKNANVLLWKVLGPHPEGVTMPPEYFRRLGVPAPPERGEYFIDLARYAKEALKLEPGAQTDELQQQQARAARRPWLEKDYPQVAAWLKANEKPLAVAVEASRRPDYYNPLVSRKTGAEGGYGLIGALLPNVQKSRELAAALAARAMRHAGEGKLDEAWQDLLACHRLGRLIARGGTLIEYLASLAINRAAGNADLALLGRANPTAKQARDWLRDLERLPPLPPAADRVDQGERFMFLDVVMLLRRQGGKALRLLAALAEEGGEGRKHLPAATDAPTEKAFEALDDWDSILRAGNVRYDRLAAACRVGDRAAREKEFDRIEEDLKALKKDAGSWEEVIEAFRGGKASGKELGKRLGDSLIATLLPAIRKVQAAADRGEQGERNLYLAFALAAYRGDHGRYPDRLEALAPGYLGEVPNDLFSGKALVYRPSENGYQLYSVGANGRDDGGHGPDDTPPGDDLSVRMPPPEPKGK
jgi:hypothetical protein